MPRILSQDDVDDFRARLCQAALKRFAEEGEGGISLRRLAADLGVSPTTPYRYFADKNEIMAALRAQAFDQFAQTLEQAFAQERDPVVRAKAVGRAYIDFALAHPQSYRLMFDPSQPEGREYPELTRAGDRARATMTAHLVALKEAGLLQGDPVLTGHVLWSTIHGLVVLHMAGKLDQKMDVRQVFDEAMRLIGLGIMADGRKISIQSGRKVA